MENVSPSTAPPPGWHPDPVVPGNLRWWSGAQWTEHVKPTVARPAAAAAAYQPSDPRDRHPAPSQTEYVKYTPEPKSIVLTNPASFVAIGVSATYLLIAFYSGYVMLGILPAYLGFKAYAEREQLWPLALMAAGVSIALALTTMGIL